MGHYTPQMRPSGVTSSHTQSGRHLSKQLRDVGGGTGGTETQSSGGLPNTWVFV